MYTGLDSLKTASKKVIHKATEAIVGFIGIKIAGKIIKLKIQEILKKYLFCQGEREGILNNLRHSL